MNCQTRSHPAPRRGSVLIVAMLIATIIGISLVSYIKLTTTSLKLAHRTFFAIQADNLVEAGLEEAVYRFNQMGSGTFVATVWSTTNGWTTDTTKIAAVFLTSGGSGYTSAPSVSFGGGGGSGVTATATISGGVVNSVKITNRGSGYAFSPTVSFSGGGGSGAAATTTNTSATRTLSTFNLDANATGTVKIFVAGYDGNCTTPLVVAKATITPSEGPPIVKITEVSLHFNGMFGNGLLAKNGITWNGRPMADSWDSGASSNPSGPFITYAAGTHNANNRVASLFGTVNLGALGVIKGTLSLGSTATYTGSNTITGGSPSRNFTFNFAMPAYPITSSLDRYYTLAGATPTTLPANLDLPNSADGRYYYFSTGSAITNTTIAAGKNVTIVGSGGTNVTGTINIPASATLKIYTDGTINGTYLNNAWAGALQLYTSTTSGTTISGNANILACIYAPNSAITGNGGGNSGDFYGSVVGATVTSNGHMNFHYDESLKTIASGKPWSIKLWREMQSSAERVLYSTQFNF